MKEEKEKEREKNRKLFDLEENDTKNNIKPDWRYVKIDETKNWDETSPARMFGKKLVATYAYNKNSVTYCCSLTPAYWMLYLGTEAQCDKELTDEQWESINDNIQESEYNDQSGYYNCSCIDAMESNPLPYSIDVDRNDFSDDAAGENEYNNKVADDIRESFLANPC